MSIESFIDIFILILDLASVLILLIGVGKALINFFISEFKTFGKWQEIDPTLENNSIKRNLGSYVLLSLEVLIAADIVKSILNPTVVDILMLGAVVVIRTIIAYFLGKEMEMSPTKK